MVDLSQINFSQASILNSVETIFVPSLDFSRIRWVLLCISVRFKVRFHKPADV